MKKTIPAIAAAAAALLLTGCSLADAGLKQKQDDGLPPEYTGAATSGTFPQYGVSPASSTQTVTFPEGYPGTN